jgi:hypothetical protein
MKLTKLTIINESKSICDEFKDLLSNKAVVNETNTIYSYCKKHNLELDPIDLQRCHYLIEKTLQNNCIQFVIMQYQLCVLTNDWAEAGEQQIKASFCRNILNLSPDTLLDASHLLHFEGIIQDHLSEYNIRNSSVQDLKHLLQNYTFSVCSTQFGLGEINKLNAILHFIGSDKKLILTKNAGHIFLYFSRIQKKVVGTYEVGYMEHEIVRSPLCIMALAALSFERTMYIRKEVLNTIFYQKWMPHFNLLEDEPWSIQYSRERNISEGIKRYIYQLKSITSADDLAKNSKPFIRDISETIIYHELGHVIFNQDILDITIASTLESTRKYGHNIFISILEILADLAPKIDMIQGAIVNLCKVAKKDRSRANEMFYMYISDVWFYDTDDQYMYDYADLILLTLSQYIHDDLTIDFEKIAYDFTTEAINRPDSILAYLTSQCAEASVAIRQMILNADYVIADKKADVKAIENYINDKFTKEGSVVDKTSYTYHVSFWRLMVEYAATYSTSQTMVKDFITSKRVEILNEMFRRTAGKELAEKYQYNAKDYLLDLFERLNLKAIN